MNLSGMNLNFVIDLFVCMYGTCSCTVRVMQLCICVCFVADVPRVRLELGRNLEGDHIREGIDVYFDCHVVARPNAVRLVWRHQVSWTKQQQLLFFLNLDPLMLMQWALHWFIKSTVLSCFHSTNSRRCRRFCRYCAQKLVLPVNATTTSSSLLIPKGQQRSTINQRLHIQYDTVRPVAATADSNSSSGLVLSNFCCIAAVVFDNNFDLD